MSILDAATTRSAVFAIVGVAIGVIALATHRRIATESMRGDRLDTTVSTLADRLRKVETNLSCRNKAARWRREDNDSLRDWIATGGEGWPDGVADQTPSMILQEPRSSRNKATPEPGGTPE
jgi:hypothetical protein